MVKNSFGGNKAKQKSRKTQQTHIARLSDLLPSEEQSFAKVCKVNGGGRYIVLCDDGKERLGVARGKINKNVRIYIDSLLLISKRDFQDGKCDVLHTFSHDEVRLLQSNNVIPSTLSYTPKEEDTEITFGEEEEVSFEDL